MMQIAFVLYKYFPHGGLQRDFMKIARECLARGHSVAVFTMEWQGDIPEGFEVQLLPVRGFSNHQRCRRFAKQLQAGKLKDRHDLVVGFNKVPGLDVYFASDPCYVARAQDQRGAFYRQSSRYRVYAWLEKTVFEPESATEVLLLNPAEKHQFIAHYQTQERRFHPVPPGSARRRPDPEVDGRRRAEARHHLNLHENDHLLLMVGSGFRTKGVDRAIRALADLPAELASRCRLVVLGAGNPKPLLQLAGKLSVAEQVAFHGVREDLSPYYLAADLLVHPSRTEAAGMVLLEALTYGVPVLVTDVCGYAFHITEAGAGEVVPTPFGQQVFSAMLKNMLTSAKRPSWRSNGLKYAAKTDLYSLPQTAVDFFEQRRTGSDDATGT